MASPILVDPCPDCDDYFERRGRVMARATAAVAREHGIQTGALALRVVRAIHDRHLAGLSLDTG